MRTVKLFVSSPKDVAFERQRVQWVADRLSGEFMHKVQFDVILWEHSVYSATGGGYQEQISKRAVPADCDIVLAIFWARLGSPLPPEFTERMPDGNPYPSGTAFEVLSALEERKRNGHHPDVFVFRKKVIPTVPIDDKAARAEADAQWDRLEDFFSQHFELADKRVLRIVEKFKATEEFERKVETLLREWIKSNVSQGVLWPIEEKGSPFRGLEPFEARHADIYCGRDRKVLRAIDELKSAARRGKPFLLIPGASGAGKSSLMRAGIAPRIVRPGAIEGVDFWRTAVMRPASNVNPLLALARSLFVTGDLKEDDPGGFGKALPELAAGPFKTPERLAELFAGKPDLACDPIVLALNQIGEKEQSKRGFERPLQVNLLLLVDQFEDIFAGSASPEKQGISTEDRAQFANLLAAMASTGRIWVISTLRGDMYERMITERPFIMLKDIGGQYDLGPPGPDELDEIVHRSAEVAGLEYEGSTDAAAGSERASRMDDRLLRDAAGENTLPLLQFALNLLFERCWGRDRSKVLTHQAYEEIGGLDGAINQTAELALARLVQPTPDPQFPLPKEILDNITKTTDPVLEVLLRKLVAPVSNDAFGAVAEQALTARIVPMPEATRDDASRDLVDALLRARILLSTRTDRGASVRIAHDRVITSWDRARTITEKNREFYRVKETIEQHQQHWEESGQLAEYLIPPGAPITQAEEMVNRFTDEFAETTQSFVRVSGRRARLRQRLMTAATLIFAAVAVVATFASYYATLQREKAITSYVASRDTIRGLVKNIADNFKDLDGINVTTIATGLDHITDAIDNLQKQSGNDPELNRINATAHFEFAKVYQNTRRLPQALKEAEIGYEIRSKLISLPAAPPDLLVEYTESLDQLGDIHRAMALAQGGDRAKFDLAQEHFDKSHAMRSKLFQETPDDTVWAFGLCQSLVRIGDQKANPAKDFAGAKAAYREALTLITEVFRREPDSPDLKRKRELSWCLNKMGDILLEDKKTDAAFAMYQNGLCTRRHLANQNPTNTLLKRDLAFSLVRVGEARVKNQELDTAELAMFEALTIRQELISRDSYQTLWLSELGDSQHRIGQFMQESNRAELAAGYFGLAIETREKVQHLVTKDNLENDEVAARYLKLAQTKLADSHKKHSELIQQLQLPPGITTDDLKGRAKAKTHEVDVQLKQQRVDSELCWNEVRTKLLQGDFADE